SLGPLSDLLYASAVKLPAPVAPPPTLALPVLPPLPLAVSVHSAAVRVPPLSLVTCFTNVRLGALSSLVMVQVAVSPLARVMLLQFGRGACRVRWVIGVAAS